MKKKSDFQKYLDWRTNKVSVNLGQSEKLFMCKICGELYKLSEEENHENTHSKVPPVNLGQKYYLTTSYRETNSDIKNGATFVPLLLNYYRDKFIETWHNALLLPDNYKVIDNNNTTVKYNRTKQMFYRSFIFSVITLICLTF